MKAYIIRIELDGSIPLIWRRVIMPAGATYRRLHDVIQNTTNFQSGYPGNGYHLSEFDLSKENKKVSDDEDAYLNHQYYLKNKKCFEDKLKTMNPNDLKFEVLYQESLKIEVRKPTSLKIDKYLEKYKAIRYHYDFGDDWWFIIKLEEIVEDYYFGYPTLLDGEGTAPPEDVGGLDGFYEFLEVYKNPNHPDYVETITWLKDSYFREYDPVWINVKLKWLDYKKTEWAKINHERYMIIEDKYRKK